MRVHLPALSHYEVSVDHAPCAYTQKLRNLPYQLKLRGHDSILYAGERTETVAIEHVNIQNPTRWFGGPWPRDVVFNRWDANDICWREMNEAAILAIDKRIQPGDIVGIIAGLCQQRIADHYVERGYQVVEWGIGYEGILTNTHHAFESLTWRHFVHGQQSMRYPDGNWGDGRFFDTVIPNTFNPSEFRFNQTPDDYLLFLGRHTARKGLPIIGELAKNHRVITAGQGDERVPNAEYVGIVVGEEKAQLLANAKAVLVPTTYIEPFGGVAVEAMMSGTPVISTDFGAFAETQVQGLTGFRCNMLREFEEAVDKVGDLDRTRIREYAMNKYSTNVVSKQYDAWLRQVATLPEPGWYAPRE